MQQPTTSTSETNNDKSNNKESFSSITSDEDEDLKDAPINARPGVTKEVAFDNMQAMLRSSAEEDVFDPFAGIAASPHPGSLRRSPRVRLAK